MSFKIESKPFIPSYILSNSSESFQKSTESFSVETPGYSSGYHQPSILTIPMTKSVGSIPSSVPVKFIETTFRNDELQILRDEINLLRQEMNVLKSSDEYGRLEELRSTVEFERLTLDRDKEIFTKDLNRLSNDRNHFYLEVTKVNHEQKKRLEKDRINMEKQVRDHFEKQLRKKLEKEVREKFGLILTEQGFDPKYAEQVQKEIKLLNKREQLLETEKKKFLGSQKIFDESCKELNTRKERLKIDQKEFQIEQDKFGDDLEQFLLNHEEFKKNLEKFNANREKLQANLKKMELETLDYQKRLRLYDSQTAELLKDEAVLKHKIAVVKESLSQQNTLLFQQEQVNMEIDTETKLLKKRLSLLKSVNSAKTKELIKSHQLNDTTCVVCLDKPREWVYKPCRHFCVCFDCKTLPKECPICCQHYEGMERVFMA